MKTKAGSNPTNFSAVRRALRRASRVLAVYPKASGNIRLTDVLTDLRHYAERHGLDFQKILDRSYLHYSCERRGYDEV